MICLLAECLISGCEEPANSPVPRQAHHQSFLTPPEFDDCAARFADALRRWPVVDKADQQILLAAPRWKNESPLAVSDGQQVARELAEAVNLRVGAKVKIVHANTIGCRYASELVLEPARNNLDQAVLALTLHVLRPGTQTSLLEEVSIVRRLPPPQAGGGLFSPRPRAAPTTRPGQPERSYQVITFERGQVHLDPALAAGRVSILGERTTRDADGKLHVELRLLSRPEDSSVEVLAYHLDASGQRRPPLSPNRYELQAFKPRTLVLTLPKSARRYDLFIAAK
ncbi:MAG: hypothetical protein JXQ73_34065 [Phycisphaerae bacterium]|nr:hypothetical protein [Phycisphaerae bacterium]